MLKVNELKNLRSGNDKEGGEIDNANITNLNDISVNNSVSLNRMNTSNSRIEINADNKNDKKIFLTDYHQVKFDNVELISFHDMIIPNGKNAKLCMVSDPDNKNLRVTEIADHFKFYEPMPVIVLIGANTKNK